MCVPKESFISCSWRAEIAENQTHNLILQLAELQCKLSSQPRSVYCQSEGTDGEGIGSWKLEWLGQVSLRNTAQNLYC